MNTSHQLDIYNQVYVHVATTKLSWKRLTKRMAIADPELPDAIGYTTMKTWRPNKSGFTELHFFIWIDTKKMKNSADLVNTCAHEATHTAVFLFDYIGYSWKDTGAEPIAYFVGWLTEWLWDNVSSEVPDSAKLQANRIRSTEKRP